MHTDLRWYVITTIANGLGRQNLWGLQLIVHK
jgi:hypothetical protein